jgi:hypothetical protein
MDKLIVEMIAGLDINTGLILILLFKLHNRVTKIEAKEAAKSEIKETA